LLRKKIEKNPPFFIISNFKAIHTSKMDLENTKHFKDSHSSSAGMDPNYYYFLTGEGELFLKDDAPIDEMGLDHVKEYEEILGEKFNQSIASTFHKLNYDSDGHHISTDPNTDKFIEWVLNLDDEKAKYVYVGYYRDTFKVSRVPKEMEKYTECHFGSKGCCGIETDVYYEIDRKSAIIDLTKKTLEDPTPEKLAHLKQKIEFYETVQIEDVKTHFFKNCDEHGCC
jgi:hypothetical protein